MSGTTATQIGCKVIADSLAPCGARLFTVEAVYPWYIHNELMTHRALSRNAASSRAIPNAKRLHPVLTDPVIPPYWGQNCKGMVSNAQLPDETITEARKVWIEASQDAIHASSKLAQLGCHKQTANRLVEPFCWMTTIISATEWSNFFYLRCHKDAQPEMRELAMAICREYYDHNPKRLDAGQWHLPYISQEDRETVAHEFKWETLEDFDELLALVSTARCARVSYLTHDGTRDIGEDLMLAARLKGGSGSGHWSPFEHPAQAQSDIRVRSGNFIGWMQFRQVYGGVQSNWSTYLKSAEEYYNRV